MQIATNTHVYCTFLENIVIICVTHSI